VDQSPRERTEELEVASLSPWGTLAGETKGRDRQEDTDSLRTAFQQDRDRILESSVLRRLGGRTRLLAGASGRRYPTRLSQVLEVARLTRTMSRALRLNEDLAEAIALGQELGQPAFGAAGEAALREYTDSTWQHAEQSVRVVERFERGGAGLNLTWEVRDGILHHAWPSPPPTTVEGQAARVASAAEWLSGDLEHAISGGIIDPGEEPQEVRNILGPAHGERLRRIAEDTVAHSGDAPEVIPTPRVARVLRVLREFLGERLYAAPAVRSEQFRAIYCLRSLTLFYTENPEALPALHQGDDPLPVRVCDHVSSLTDRAALVEFRRRFLPGLHPLSH
jgi:dGTPase